MFVLLASAAATGLEAAQEVAAPSGVAALGLDFKALLFQVANFIILLVILRIFAYPPIIRVLEARRTRIEESLKNAEQIEKEKVNLERMRDVILQETHQKAREILQKSESLSQSLVEEGRSQATAEAQHILARAQERIEQETRAARAQLRQEVAQLTVRAAEKILGEKLDSQKDQELIKRAVAKPS